MAIEYTETDENDLDLIESLWQKLNDHHGMLSEHFSESYPKYTFSRRKKELLEKSSGGAMRIDLARENETGNLIGYCVSTISKHNKGEIDSIYINEGYRRAGIGDAMMKRALQWMDGRPVTRKVIAVVFGNEDVFPFYSQYNFLPRATILEQVDT